MKNDVANNEIPTRLYLPMKVDPALHENFSLFLDTSHRIQKQIKEHQIPLIWAHDIDTDSPKPICFIDEVVISKLLVNQHDFVLCDGNPYPFGFEHPEYLEISCTPMIIGVHDTQLNYFRIQGIRCFVLNVEPKRYSCV
jgi:hypothetical protein